MCEEISMTQSDCLVGKRRESMSVATHGVNKCVQRAEGRVSTAIKLLLGHD